MKIILISNSSKSVLNFRGKLIDELLSKGIQVVVLLRESEGSDFIIKALIEKGCIVEKLYLNRAGINILDDLKTFFNIYKVLYKHKPDYVLSYTIKPIIYGSMAAKILGIKNIFPLITGLGYAFTHLDKDKPKSITQKIIFSLYKIALACSKKVFFQNEDDAKLFENMKLVNKDKILVVNGSGVDLSYFEYNDTILKQSTEQSTIKFLMLGRIIKDKGIREYVEAARQLKIKYGEKVEFQLAGGLDINPSAIQKSELDDWISAGYINYLGKLSDVRPTLKNIHVFVLPSYREGTSRSILEAMSIGKPIVTTNVPGCRQLVENGKNGFLVEARSANSLIEGIEKVINMSCAERLKMSEHSRNIVEDKYDVIKVNNFMLQKMDII